MVVSEMLRQVQDITKIERTDAELVDDFNRGLLDLSSSLFLLETFEQAWEAGVASYPAPPSVLEFRRYGIFRPNNGSPIRLPRVPQGEGGYGWWYDGSNIGIQTDSYTAPDVGGTFTLPYLRYPKMLSVADTFAEPDGGDAVSQALINYACYVAYASVGDEVSMGLAHNFRSFYEQAKSRIHAQRSRLMNVTPKAWSLK